MWLPAIVAEIVTIGACRLRDEVSDKNIRGPVPGRGS